MIYVVVFMAGIAFVPLALFAYAAGCDAWHTWTQTDMTVRRLFWFLAAKERWRSSRMRRALAVGHALGKDQLWVIDPGGALGYVEKSRAAGASPLSVLPTCADPRIWLVAFKALFGYGKHTFDPVTPDADRAAWIEAVQAARRVRLDAKMARLCGPRPLFLNATPNPLEPPHG